MKIINDSANHPLRLVDPERTLGQFYNSWDSMYHLSEYIPYTTLPTVYICGKTGNFSPSRKHTNSRNKCPECWERFNQYESDLFSVVSA